MIWVILLFASFLDSQNAIGMSATGPCVPIIPGTDFSVPPPNFYPGYQAPPVTVPGQKTAADIEYDKTVAEFLQKTSKGSKSERSSSSKKDDLDDKINEHLSSTKRPRRTFTDHPVVEGSTASGSGRGKKQIQSFKNFFDCCGFSKIANF